MSTFGAKEPWMEPMNKFLHASRPEFKAFVDQICSVPSERPSQAVSASYATPIQILARLPPTSREGFPSLPFLIDSAKSFASLISLWLQKCPVELEARLQKDIALRRFHELCVEIQQQTKDCLSSAEAAERPGGDFEAEWERLLEERERSITFYDEPGSPALSPTVEAEASFSYADPVTKRHSNGFFMSPPSPPSLPPGNSEWPPERPRSSTSFRGDQSRPNIFRNRASETKASAASSKNSSTLSFDATETPRARSNTASKDSSSKNRFKDFVSGSARRKMREGVQGPRAEGRNNEF